MFPVPQRKAVAARAAKLYEHAIGILATQLSTWKAWYSMPALTCDGWTALSGDGFLSLTLHLIPPDWTDIVVVSLGVLPLAPPHDACHIAEAIQKGLCLLGWDGEGKATITTNSTAVMPAAVQNLNFEW